MAEMYLAFRTRGEKPTLDIEQAREWVEEGRVVECRPYWYYGRGRGHYAKSKGWSTWNLKPKK